MKPKHGAGPTGEPFDPESLPEEPPDPESQPRPAPAPGVPMSDEEFERLKREAERGTVPKVDKTHKDRETRDG